MKRFGLLAAALALVSVNCVSQAKYDAQVKAAKDLQKKLDVSQQEAKDLQTKLNDMDTKLADLTKQLKGLETSSARMKSKFAKKLAMSQAEFERKLAEAQKEAREMAKMFKDLRSKFRKLIQAGNLSIQIIHGRLVLKLKSAVLFASGKVMLKRAGSNALKDIAAVLKTIKRHFQVAGHTDDQPVKRSAFKNNWELSAARAVQVVMFLSKNGVPAKNLSAAGFSQYQPVATNRSGPGRQMNRRIEISLLPAIPSQLIK